MTSPLYRWEGLRVTAGTRSEVEARRDERIRDLETPSRLSSKFDAGTTVNELLEWRLDTRHRVTVSTLDSYPLSGSTWRGH